MEPSRELAQMDAAELRNLATTLYAELAKRDTERSTHAALVAELKAKQLKIDQLTHEMAILKTLAVRSSQRADGCAAAFALRCHEGVRITPETQERLLFRKARRNPERIRFAS